MNSPNELYAKFRKIGMRVNHGDHPETEERVDIEKTLVEAAYQIDEDGRILGLVFSWLFVHGDHVLADKFFKESEVAKAVKGECPWITAICAYRVFLKDLRFKKGLVPLRGPHHYQNSDQSTLIKLKGSVPYLEAMNIFLATTSLRIRTADVLTVNELIRMNPQYRNRYIYGANWRAEIIREIEEGAKSGNQIAKRLGIAQSRVSIVFKEYGHVQETFAQASADQRFTVAGRSRR
jgi:hypothetical protein